MHNDEKHEEVVFIKSSRIIFLTPKVPYPPINGGLIGTLSVLRMLADTGSVSGFFLAESEEEIRSLREIQRYFEKAKSIVHPVSNYNLGWRAYLKLAASLATASPFVVKKSFSQKLAREFCKFLEGESYDIALFDEQAMIPYAGHVSSKIKVLFCHTVGHEVLEMGIPTARNPIKRAVLQIQADLYKSYLQKQASKFDGIMTRSQRDADIIQALVGPKVPCFPVPLPVDFSNDKLPVGEDPAPTILIVGSCTWAANLDQARWYLEEILPRLRQRVPTAKTLMIGASPPLEVSRFHGKDGVEVLGFVEDLEEIYRRAWVLAVPLRIGSGIRVKIVNAMVRGLPVVSTLAGADGLGLEPGKHFWLANEPEVFAEVLEEIFKNSRLRNQVAENAHEFASEHFSYESVSKSFAGFLHDLLKSKANVSSRDLPEENFCFFKSKGRT